MAIERISKAERIRGPGASVIALVCALAVLALPAFASPGAQARQAPSAITHLGSLIITPNRNAPPAIAPPVESRAEAIPARGRTPVRPLHIVTPTYPQAALAQGQRGSVTIVFTIAPNGRTEHVHIASAVPSGVFDRATLQAARQWRFRPATVNGKPVAITASQTLVFNPPLQKRAAPQPPPPPRLAHARPRPMTTAPSTKPPPAKLRLLHSVAPQYPASAYRQKIGGSVTVRFTVGLDGKTHHIRIIKAHPRGVFNHAAIQAVRQWRFKPPSTPTQVTQTVHFTPPGH
jgi:TonB family protein